jgi:magnesium transporter
MRAIPIYIVIFEECILTISPTPTSHPMNVRKRIDNLSVYGIRLSSQWINYALIDDIIDGYLPIMAIIDHEVDIIEDLVLTAEETDHSNMIRRIGVVRKRVTSLLKLTNTKPDVLKTIINRYQNQSTETKFYLEDIQDHITTMGQNLLNYEYSLSRSHSNYLAQISIKITQASNRTSDVVMRMTLLASILVPLNIITGLWGMNVRVPGQEVDSLHWFFSIIAVMMVVVISTWTIIIRLNLIDATAKE